jgi:glutathione peroxidase-family protein
MTPISCISKSQADVNGATTQPIYKVLKEKAGVKDIDWYVLPIRLAY